MQFTSPQFNDHVPAHLPVIPTFAGMTIICIKRLEEEGEYRKGNPLLRAALLYRKATARDNRGWR